MNRKTLRHSVNVKGIGLHSGEKVSVWLHPAEAGVGISLRVSNSQGNTTVPALVPFVANTQRRVVLQKDGVAIQTVEHLLATCLGMGVTELLGEQLKKLSGFTHFVCAPKCQIMLLGS